jgi:predicted metal-dependent hydrolase
MNAPTFSDIPLPVRRLHVDLAQPFAARWCGGDAFRSAFFNALSMSFPVGEQYFIDSLKNGAKKLAPTDRGAFDEALRGFVGQEATHRHLHALFNRELQRQGLVNEFERRATRRIQANQHLDARKHVAVTAATEHFTALFAQWLMRHPEVLDGAEQRLAYLWLWHSAEESEHRNVAFDLYRAMGGNEYWRLRIFRYVTFTFLSDVLRQTARNLWQDGSFFKWGTWRSGWRLLLSHDGLLRSNWGAWKDYLATDFHPSQHDASLSAQWLARHTADYTVVRVPNTAAAAS